MTPRPIILEETMMCGDKVYHYTCQSVDVQLLKREGIELAGCNFGCEDPREVLVIPLGVYDSYGIVPRQSDITIMTEVLLRKLDHKSK